MKARIIISLVFGVFLVYDVFPCTVTISNIKTSAVYGKVIDEDKKIIPNAKIQIYKIRMTAKKFWQKRRLMKTEDLK